MSQITTVGLDLAKNVFQVHGADIRDGVVFRKKLRRSAVLEFFSKLPPCLVAMEACGGAHFWGWELARRSRLISRCAKVAGSCPSP